MENSVSLKIPLEAKLAVGKDWANMKPLELDLIKTGVSSSFKIVQNLFGNEWFLKSFIYYSFFVTFVNKCSIFNIVNIFQGKVI